MLSQDVAAANEQRYHRKHVRHVEEDSSAGGIGAEGDRGPEVQQPKEHVEDEGEDDRADRDVKFRCYMGEAWKGGLVSFVWFVLGVIGGRENGKNLLARIHDPLVPRHRIQQPARTRHAPIRTIDKANCQHKRQYRRRGPALRPLQYQLRNRHIRRRIQHRIRVRDTKQNNKYKSDARDSAHDNSVYNRARRILRRPRHLLRHMQRGIEPNQTQRALQQSQYPRHPVRPPGLVIKLSEHVARVVLIGGREQHDTDYDDAEQRPVQRGVVPAPEDPVPPDVGAGGEG